MKHIVSLSGGKDSTAMLLMMLEEGMPVDEVITCDTGMEYPQMYEHIDKLEAYTGMEFTRIKDDHSWDYYMYDYERKRGPYKGVKGYGWPGPRMRWCTKLLKTVPIKRYLKKYEGQEIVQYIGIAWDERNRVKEHRYPLVDWEVTEAEALQHCYDHGFDWGGLYEIYKRVNCWCCPLQGLQGLRDLRKHFPDKWKGLIEMDKDTFLNRKFRSDYSVAELERKFKLEELGLINERERKKVFDDSFHPEIK